jgi:hypothetical protein
MSVVYVVRAIGTNRARQQESIKPIGSEFQLRPVDVVGVGR